MARLHSYIVARDFGFAPNPFFGYCTLATCMVYIREGAEVGDWVAGTGSGRKSVQREGYLVFAMRVEEILTFDEYWSDPRFRVKRPRYVLKQDEELRRQHLPPGRRRWILEPG